MKRVLSTVMGIWLVLMTILPAHSTLASTAGKGFSIQTPAMQCEIKPPQPGLPPRPCVKPNDVSWNS